MSGSTTFSAAHRLYVKSLYKRFLNNSLNWTIRRDLWRPRALQIRAEFERHRHVTDPRALAILFEHAEAWLAANAHPDPYIPAAFPGGTKWERNIPPRMEPIFDHMQVPSEEGSTLHENGAHVVAAKPTSEEWEKYIDTKFKYEDGTEGTSKVHKLFK